MEHHDAPRATVRAPQHLVASADHLASAAGSAMFAAGGNAVDAAIATNAVDAAIATNAAIAITGPHLCGIGGDLFALVHVDGEVHALNASGRAGSGADAEALRSRGLSEMPFRHDIAAVTVPGCVDGWLALHERFGSLPLAVILAPAIRLAADGFPASPLLARSAQMLDERGRAQLSEIATQATRRGARVRRPGAAAVLAALIDGGRESFYGGPFGSGLIELGHGLFAEADLERSCAEWVDTLSTDAFGVTLHTIPPNSQGYLALASARLAERTALPSSPNDTQWAHLLIEASKAAGRDRTDVLHDAADGNALLAAIDGRLGEIDPERAGLAKAPGADGDTTYLCTTGIGGDGKLMGVSLIQSNAAGFGSLLVEPNTQINLHNRGMGFSLTPGNPAEFAPGRRPPHTLAPCIATDGPDLRAVFGTMGGDAQPQILLQLAARLFHHGQTPAAAVNAGRWALRGPVTGFDTWTAPDGPHVNVEGHAPEAWAQELADRGHVTAQLPAWDSGFGHAHAIIVGRDGILGGAADPRTVVGSCTGG